MYCSECGQQAEGKFCSSCGVPLSQPSGAWENEIRYEMLIRIAEVREMIQQHARLARKGITGEQYLALCDKIIPMGVPLDLLAAVVQRLYASWGFGTGKERSAKIATPVGRMMLRVLCSLARRGQTLRNVQQATDGCVFEAALPSDLWSFEGDLLITIHRHDSVVEVQAATKIKGQLFDWGKSTRCLDALFADLHQELTQPLPSARAA